MAVNLVTCSKCGRVFDSVAEHCLLDRNTGDYTCSNCLSHNAAARSRSTYSPSAAASRQNVFIPPTARTGKPRSKVGNVLRIVFGILFVLTAFSSIKDGDDVWLTCLVIGLGLLIWQFWPQLKALFLRKKTREAMLKQQEEFQAREAERRAREAARKKICSHCGATTSGFVCEYCGMPLEEK